MLVFVKLILEAAADGRGIGDLSTDGTYYAFLTRGEDGGLIIADLRGFAKSTVGDCVEPALNELISSVTPDHDAQDREAEAELISPEETDMLSVEWANLKLFNEEEAKDIVETFIPAYEETREAGVRFWTSRSGTPHF